MNLGSKIKTLRKSKNIAQYELAEIAGISNSYLSDIENGRSNPSISTLSKIALALEIDIKDLFE